VSAEEDTNEFDVLEDDEVDGCDVDLTKSPTPDGDLDGIVLFADVDLADVDRIERRVAEYDELFGGKH
jgi:hypothetical protein